MVSHNSVALVIKYYPVGLAERNHPIAIIRAEEKDVKALVNGYTKKNGIKRFKLTCLGLSS